MEEKPQNSVSQRRWRPRGLINHGEPAVTWPLGNIAGYCNTLILLSAQKASGQPLINENNKPQTEQSGQVLTVCEKFTIQL
ncbi:MAG: hypothetical protein AMJ53_13745 [Gammaproteobacteria bacterium SG8_11]|nr:MAG: hypothetical protein AMJ53_13745 [Gammaproteobacteria bacterium SG8_11]